MTEHHFDIAHAEKYGVIEAVIINNLKFWIEKNAANNKHFYEGKFWTYNSIPAFGNLFPYLSKDQIRYALKKLVDKEVLIKGNFNKSTFDKTLWYTFNDQGDFIQYHTVSENDESPASMYENSPTELSDLPDLICNTDNKLTDKKQKINKKSPKVTLAEWEEKNGELDIDHLREWGKKNNLDANMVYKAIQDFRDRVVAGGYLYADYAAAFRTWHKDKFDELRKQSTKPVRML